MSRADDTVFALASGAGRAGVAVIRVSGPAAGAAFIALTGGLPEPRRAALRALYGAGGGLIDRALTLWFPAPHSFTGEDVAEFHVHGGQAVIAALSAALLDVPGLRPAEPGDFTRRAFENGKLDLAEAEGLADLIDAETEGQRQQALRQMDGALSRLYDGWRAQLVTAMALLEAAIDFPDEDLPEALAERVGPLLAPLAAAMAEHLADTRGERVREGFRVAILGKPNAGKSSLLNALAGRDVAIVSDTPGTTRDVIEVRLVLAGFPILIADTAGLRASEDAIEQEGVRRALARAEDADLRVFLAPVDDLGGDALPLALRPDDLVFASKADLGAEIDQPRLSAKTGEGVDALLAAIAARAEAALGAREAPALTRARHRRLVEQAHASLLRAQSALQLGPELAAEDLRAAAAALGRLTGRIDVETLLDEIFAQFCIGK